MNNRYLWGDWMLCAQADIADMRMSIQDQDWHSAGQDYRAAMQAYDLAEQSKARHRKRTRIKTCP